MRTMDDVTRPSNATIDCMSAANKMAATHQRRIRPGDFVLFDKNGEKQVCVKIKEGGTFLIDGKECASAAVIDAPYGSLFQFDTASRSLQKCQRICETAEEDWGQVLEIDRNNSKLEDGGASHQALTAADIDLLKAEGKSGAEIIAALTQASATFQGKTQYSQEKYKRKKAKKYITRITAVRPTARALADFYFFKTPSKTGWLRADSLALMLTLANVGAGCRALTIDSVGGLVTGSVLERMGGIGDVVAGFAGDTQPSQDIINLFNFPQSARDSFMPASLKTLHALLLEARETSRTEETKETKDTEDAADQRKGKRPRIADGADEAASLPSTSETPSVAANNVVFTDAEAAASVSVAPPSSEPLPEPNGVLQPAEVREIQPSQVSSSEGRSASQPEAMDTAPEVFGSPVEAEEENAPTSVGGSVAPAAAASGLPQSPAGEGEAERERAEQLAQKRLERAAREETVRNRLRRVCGLGFQSCIVASPGIRPTAVMEPVLELLAPSASFAIFFPSLQPLAECMHHLQMTRSAVALQLQESWMREHQVLPGRTHPKMAMSGSGGYVLSGIKVLAS